MADPVTPARACGPIPDPNQVPGGTVIVVRAVATSVVLATGEQRDLCTLHAATCTPLYLDDDPDSYAPPRDGAAEPRGWAWGEYGEPQASDVVAWMFVTPEAPFGRDFDVISDRLSDPLGGKLSDEEKANLYWAALQAACSRPEFQRELADAWVRAAMRLEAKLGKQQSHPKSLLHKLRSDALAAAQVQIRDTITSAVDHEIRTTGLVQSAVKSVAVEKTIREFITSEEWATKGGGARNLVATVRDVARNHLSQTVADSVGEVIGPVLVELLRSSHAMVDAGVRRALSDKFQLVDAELRAGK